jgi:hypothetical protein
MIGTPRIAIQNEINPCHLPSTFKDLTWSKPATFRPHSLSLFPHSAGPKIMTDPQPSLIHRRNRRAAALSS